jgi:tetratricopeptide (TPR) repeat protein
MDRQARQQTFTLISALAVGCLAGSTSARATVGARNGGQASQTQSATRKNCPPQNDLDAALGNASSLIGGSHFQDAARELQPIASINCDARVSLLLAAAFEGQGDVAKATAALERAHAVWPANDSISASLAREYLNGKQVDKALKALAHFHVTAKTSEQEMRMAVVVYLAGRRLVAAHTVAEAAWKSYPSSATLLLLANTLQLQGRYPDVIRLLGEKRTQYDDSPEFLITLAESEFDASSYKTARDDLQHAISLDSNLYQAHYLLGNVLAKVNEADGAVAEYRKAIELAPDQPRTYFQLALVLRAKQDDAGEQRTLEQALAADSHYAPAQCEMGRILLEGHHPSDAVNHLNTAIEANPRLEEGYFLLARAYAQMGEKDKSDQMVKRLLAVKKENRPTQDGKNEPPPVANPSTNP